MNIDFDEHYDKIYRYCYFKVKNQHVAEDNVNEISFSDLSKLYGKSRFALYRELSKITKKLERRLSDGT